MKTIFSFVLACSLLILGTESGSAGSATWALNPNGGSWDELNPSNWVPNTVPNGPDDIATFDVSNITAISANDIEVNSIVFNPGASAYTITGFSIEGLTILGTGVINNSGTTQNFDTSTPFGNIFFTNSASAGSDTIYTAKAGRFSGEEGGDINFYGTSNGGSATFIAKGSQFDGNFNGEITFAESSSAANATVIAEAGAISGGALVTFEDGASAGAATLIANYLQSGWGGGLVFERYSSGGSPRVILYGNGTNEPGNGALSLAGRKLSAGDFTIGSLEGDGQVFIGTPGPNFGTLNLNIGSNNLSTTFGGLISGSGNTGVITKIGTGTLTLTNGASTYAGTNVNRGTLLVSNTTGLGAGGPIKVNAGTLGGSGTVLGPVTIGLGNGTGAFLAPAHGMRQQATFTIQNSLTFKADSTYTYTAKAKPNRSRTDKVVAGGVTIESGATFSLRATIQGTLIPGTVFTAISNTSATPITGAFSNLPDGGLITVGGTTFQADYEGGDGNDLTLTVQ